jgi:hypothetical protein
MGGFETTFFHYVVATTIKQWNWQTILIGASFLGFLLFTKYIVRQTSNYYVYRSTFFRVPFHLDYPYY